MPGAANPQAWNRYTYVLGNPVAFVDPTGHVTEDSFCTGQSGQPEECYGIDIDDDGALQTGDVISLPENIKEQLEKKGAHAELLDGVIINADPDDLGWRANCTGSWNKDTIARTWFNTIYWCQLDKWNDAIPSGYLVHELVHVGQFARDPEKTMDELRLTTLFLIRDAVVGRISEDWDGYHPYETSYVEVQASICQQAYNQDPNLRLDMPTCNLWITSP